MGSKEVWAASMRASEPVPTVGATVCIAAITYVQKVVGSLSVWSSESHAVERSRCAAEASQAARSVVLPKPAGAETSVSRASMPDGSDDR